MPHRIVDKENNNVARVNTDGELRTNTTVSVHPNTVPGSQITVVEMTKNQDISTSSFTTLYSTSGSGKTYGFYLHFNNTDIEIKWTVDGHDIIASYSIADMPEAEEDPVMCRIGSGSNTAVYIRLDNQISYSSSLSISAKAVNSNRKLLNGHITLYEEA